MYDCFILSSLLIGIKVVRSYQVRSKLHVIVENLIASLIFKSLRFLKSCTVGSLEVVHGVAHIFLLTIRQGVFFDEI